jgi:hypothetical protein
MRSRPSLRTLIGIATVIGGMTAATAAQSWKQGRTPDGQPDLQGTWINFDSTPFEAPDPRPAGRAGGDAGTGPAPEFADHTHKVSERRRSMVVDPPDGRIPVMKWAEDKRDYDLAHIPDAPEHETPWVRCITRGHPAGMFPAGYNNAYQIIQTPGYVFIVAEMIHETRIIPIDGRPRLNERIRQWNGEPRGRWEGNTLVVETANFSSKSFFMGATDNLRVVERFTRTAPDRIEYEITVTDPTTWARPWTAMMPLRQRQERLFEYACHEGNFEQISGMVRGAQVQAGQRVPGR